jgi:hypothetical protein
MPNYRQLTASNLVATAACASCGGGGGDNNITITDCVTGQPWSIDTGSYPEIAIGSVYRYTRTGSGTVYCGTVTRNDNAGLKNGDIENPNAYGCGDTVHCP